ncbi:MAG: hypothetical protein LUD79_01260 [Oscillospiraceae bacterium]|nr:hypothetical protein [Oscillospiraceae bacterium]
MRTGFYCGMGLGMAMGAAAGCLLRPEKKKKQNKLTSRALKTVSSILENAADSLAR